MAKRKKKKESAKRKFEHWTELIGLIMIIVSILSIVPEPLGIIGQIGASFAMFLIGTGYQILLLITLFLGFYAVYKREWPDFFTTRLIGFYVIVIGFIVLSHINYVTTNHGNILIVFQDTVDNLLENFSNSLNGNMITLKGAGIIGASISTLFYKLFDVLGTYIVSIILIVLGIVLTTGINVLEILLKPFKKKKKKKPSLEDTGVVVNDSSVIQDALTQVESKEDNKIKIHSIEEITHLKEEPLKPELDPLSSRNVTSVGPVNPVSVQQEPLPEVKINDNTNYHYKLPSLSILTPAKKKPAGSNNEMIENYIMKLEKVLKDFGITAKVVEVNVGPSVTQYELEISSGTKMSKITSLNKEISLALAKKDVRIQAPIPGKSTIGIELANDTITPVGLREILESFPANKEKSKLMVALGKNIMGNSIFCEIDKTPHLLVAGATGSGKSVCINCIIASLLMRTKPSEVKLVLVDPKKVELSMMEYHIY